MNFIVWLGALLGDKNLIQYPLSGHLSNVHCLLLFSKVDNRKMNAQTSCLYS